MPYLNDVNINCSHTVIGRQQSELYYWFLFHRKCMLWKSVLEKIIPSGDYIGLYTEKQSTWTNTMNIMTV